LGASDINDDVSLDELSREDGILLSSQGVLTAQGDEIGIIPLIAMLKSHFWFIYSNGTNHSIHVTTTATYFVNFELLLKNYTF
jgi:hypothetical protein